MSPRQARAGFLRRFATALPQPIETHIHRYSVQPCLKFRALRPPPRGVLPEAQEGFLRRIFGASPLAKHAIAGGEDAVRMAKDERARCCAIAASGPRHKRFVAVFANSQSASRAPGRIAACAMPEYVAADPRVREWAEDGLDTLVAVVGIVTPEGIVKTAAA